MCNSIPFGAWLGVILVILALVVVGFWQEYKFCGFGPFATIAKCIENLRREY